MPTRLAFVVFVIAVALAVFTIGMVWAREPVGAFFGLLTGFGSAALWAIGSVAGAPWNARLNLFAALSAAGREGRAHPARAGGHGVAAAPSDPGRRAMGDARSALQGPRRFRRRAGL